jgi:hypothetical protein
MSARLPEKRGGDRPEAINRRKLLVLCSIGLAVGVVGTIATMRHDNGATAVTGQGGQRTYAVSDFERISAVGPRQVVVSVGPAFSVRGTGSADALDRFEVAVDHGALKIEPKHSAWWDFSWGKTGSATFYVTLPQLSAASFVGSGDMKIDKVTGQRFAASVAGSGQMEIGALSVDDAEFSLAGSGDLAAGGKVARAHVSVAGSGDMNAPGLISDTAEVSMVGSGGAALTVNSQADISIIGSGDVAIGGSAHCKVSRIGSGDVKCPT